MKTPEQLERLETDCTNLYAERIKVEQDEHGRLTFIAHKNGVIFDSIRLSPWGEASIGRRPGEKPELWRYELTGLQEHDMPIGTLDEHFIVGLLES